MPHTEQVMVLYTVTLCSDVVKYQLWYPTTLLHGVITHKTMTDTNGGTIPHHYMASQPTRP